VSPAAERRDAPLLVCVVALHAYGAAAVRHSRPAGAAVAGKCAGEPAAPASTCRRHAADGHGHGDDPRAGQGGQGHRPARHVPDDHGAGVKNRLHLGQLTRDNLNCELPSCVVLIRIHRLLPTYLSD